jgi:hypothetical protein
MPLWRLWLMNQAFRFARGQRQGFGPGVRNLVRYEVLRLWHWLYEPDRLRWRALKLRHVLARRRSHDQAQ